MTPSVVPLGPKPRQGRAATGGRAAGWRRRAKTEARVPTLACTLPQGLRAGEEDRKEQSGHTLRGPQATGSCVSSAPVRLFQHSQSPLLPAQGHLHVPLQRGSRSPAQPAGELPGAMPGSTHSSQRPSRHFRERWLAESGRAGLVKEWVRFSPLFRRLGRLLRGGSQERHVAVVLRRQQPPRLSTPEKSRENGAARALL